jgi:protein SCO1
VKRLAVLLVCFFWASTAQGGLTQADLAGVAASPPPGARLDLRLAAPDAAGVTRTIGAILAGRPAFFTFVDYTCTTLCGTSLALLADALERSKLAPSDYRVVVMGIDPKDTPGAATEMATREMPERLRAAGVFLLPDRDTISRATAALGFRYAYDAANDRFAHASAVYVIGSDGGVRRVLSPFALTTGDMESALTGPAGPSLADRVRLLCYGLDPLHGVYTARIIAMLRLAGVLTVAMLASAVLFLIRRGLWAR